MTPAAYDIQCVNCKREFRFDPSKEPRSIVASGRFKVKTKKTHKYAVTCPHCDTRNIVEVST